MLRKQKHHISINSRLTYLTLGIFVFAGVIAARLFYLQVIKHGEYLELARNQQQYSTDLLPDRGNIYFREDKTGKLVTMATTQKGYTLYIDNRYLKDPESAYGALNTITPIDRTVFDAIVKKTNDPYEVLKQRVPLEEGDKIQALKVAGVGLQAKAWRLYPGDTMASQVLGFVSYTNDVPKGQYGAEKYFESALQGSGGGTMSGEKDARGIILALTDEINASSQEGGDITLTIEPAIQQAAEDELKHLQEAWHPVRGGIAIVEPKTGKIKAMAAFPNFNPNEYSKEKDLSVFLNPFVEKIYEMGSVFKPLTMAAALDRGLVTPDTTYYDIGQIKINNRTISNFDGKARGTRTMTQILEESLNTGAVFVMQKLGTEIFKQYFLNYGLTEKTGIDLPGEVAGNWNNIKTGREVEFATASFGQGIAVTPLELIMALSSLGNGGELLKPYIDESQQRTVIRRVLTPETSRTITGMLVDVVDKALIGGKAKKEGYTIAAKTGTAQVIAANGKGYATDQYLHSFFGYFPAYDPRFVVFLFIDRPQGVQYASHSLTDSFSALVDFLINYYTIPPDRTAL